jgi:hypothetical protein
MYNKVVVDGDGLVVVGFMKDTAVLSLSCLTDVDCVHANRLDVVVEGVLDTDRNASEVRLLLASSTITNNKAVVVIIFDAIIPRPQRKLPREWFILDFFE